MGLDIGQHLCDGLPGLQALVIDSVHLQRNILSGDGELRRPLLIWEFLLPRQRPAQPRVRIRGTDADGLVVERDGLILDDFQPPGWEAGEAAPAKWIAEMVAMVEREYKWQWKNYTVQRTVECHLRSCFPWL